MNKSLNGFREIAHTADLEIQVWGENLTSLFQQAAQGLYHLARVEIISSPKNFSVRSVHVEGIDWEDVLVTYLDELLYLLEEENLAFMESDLEIKDKYILEGQLKGTDINTQGQGIKAVTYHNLKIKETKSGVETNIVFDV